MDEMRKKIEEESVEDNVSVRSTIIKIDYFFLCMYWIFTISFLIKTYWFGRLKKIAMNISDMPRFAPFRHLWKLWCIISWLHDYYQMEICSCILEAFMNVFQFVSMCLYLYSARRHMNSCNLDNEIDDEELVEQLKQTANLHEQADIIHFLFVYKWVFLSWSRTYILQFDRFRQIYVFC